MFRLELGQDALARDWPAVHAMLAPWLRATWTVERVRRFFEDEYRSTLAENDVEGTAYEFGANSSGKGSCAALCDGNRWFSGQVKGVEGFL